MMAHMCDFTWMACKQVRGRHLLSPSTYALPTNSNFYIGAYVAPRWCALGFNGSIDEVRVFNRALSTLEILGFYQTTP
jgi:hypothetical protein